MTSCDCRTENSAQLKRPISEPDCWPEPLDSADIHLPLCSPSHLIPASTGRGTRVSSRGHPRPATAPASMTTAAFTCPNCIAEPLLQHARWPRSPQRPALTRPHPSAIVCSSPSAHRQGHAPPMHATPRIAPHPRLHSNPKPDRLRVDPSGSVQLTVSVMLPHNGYDPVR